MGIGGNDLRLLIELKKRGHIPNGSVYLIAPSDRHLPRMRLAALICRRVGCTESLEALALVLRFGGAPKHHFASLEEHRNGDKTGVVAIYRQDASSHAHQPDVKALLDRRTDR